MSAESCADCGSTEFVTETIVEHDCGYIAPRTAFDGGQCSKCEREVSDPILERVSTIHRCLGCGRRLDTAPGAETVRNRSMPEVTFPDLPEPGDRLSWIPSRFMPDSERGRQVVASVLVVLVLTSGIVGAVIVTPYMQAEEFEGEEETTADVDRTWNEYETVVMFRNDDIQPWYERESFDEINRLFLEEEVPVTHAVIPAVGDDEVPITEDQDICDEMTRLESEHPDLFEMTLHGYTHEPRTDFMGGSEFADIPIETQRDWLEEGESIHEDCVGSSPETFIPPMNTYDSNTVEVLGERDYTTVSGAAWMTEAYYDEEVAVFEESGLIHVSMYEEASMIDWSIDGNEDEEYYDIEELEQTFDEAYETNTPYVHMLHYFTFTEQEHYDLLQEFIQYTKSKDDVAFMTIGEFGSGIADGEIERTSDGWRVLEPVDEQSSSGQVNESITSPLSDDVRAEEEP